MTNPQVEVVEVVATGRRESDVQVVVTKVFHTGWKSFLNVLSIWKEKRSGDWSVSRISWTIVLIWGTMFVRAEIAAPGIISNAAWIFVGSAFGACSVAVFGPKMVDYWKNGGSAAIANIAHAIRDPRLPSRLDDERHD
jgi:hypothetical protein